MTTYGADAYGAGLYGVSGYGSADSPFALISGVTYTMQAGSLNINSAIGQRSTAAMTVRTDAPMYFPEDSQTKIYDKNGVLIFAGYLNAPNYNKPGYAKKLYHRLSACDKHRLADKRRVLAVFTNTTAAYIAHWLIDNILSAEGVTAGHIYAAATCSTTLYCSPTLYCSDPIGFIDAIVFDWCTVAEAYDDLVKRISSGGIPFYWQINYNATLDLVPYDAITNPTIIDGSGMDEVVMPPKVTRSNPAYRNRQILKGGTVETVLQNETRIGDGNTQSWPMIYALSQAPTITVNSAAKTVGVRGVDTGKDFYWAKGDPNISQDSAGTKLTSSQTMAIAYIGQYDNTAIVSNDAQIALSASIAGDSGIVENLETIALDSLESQLSVAGARLTRYAVQSPPQFEYATRDTGFAPGQFVVVNIPDLSLNLNMLIESISADDSTDGYNIWYHLKLISGPSDTTWVQFWGELTGTANSSSNTSTATTTIITTSQSFSIGVSMSLSFSPVVYSCPICSVGTLCDTTLYVC